MDNTDVARAVRQMLESLQRAGVTHLPHSTSCSKGPSSRFSDANQASGHMAVAKVGVVPAPKEERQATAAASLFAESERESFGANLAPSDKLAALAVLQTEVAGCTRCKELADTRTQTVFGVGNPNARLVFIGEAPGADEDARGEPFVGRAGQLLNDIITKAMKLRREDVYILNVLKCRPPNNRNPAPNEVINCRGFFDSQLQILQPEFICCLGSIAAKALLNTDLSIGRLRKKFHDYHGIPVLCTYHPAYLLRNPAAKRDVWEDIQLLMKRMGLPV